MCDVGPAERWSLDISEGNHLKVLAKGLRVGFKVRWVSRGYRRTLNTVDLLLHASWWQNSHGPVATIQVCHVGEQGFIHDNFSSKYCNRDWIITTFYFTSTVTVGPLLSEDVGSKCYQRNFKWWKFQKYSRSLHWQLKFLSGRPQLWLSEYQPPCLTPELAEVLTFRIKLPLVPLTYLGGCHPVNNGILSSTTAFLF